MCHLVIGVHIIYTFSLGMSSLMCPLRMSLVNAGETMFPCSGKACGSYAIIILY